MVISGLKQGDGIKIGLLPYPFKRVKAAKEESLFSLSAKNKR